MSSYFDTIRSHFSRAALKRLSTPFRIVVAVAVFLLILATWPEPLNVFVTKTSIVLDMLSSWLDHPYLKLIYVFVAFLLFLVLIQQTQKLIRKEEQVEDIQNEQTISEIKDLLRGASTLPLLQARKAEQMEVLREQKGNASDARQSIAHLGNTLEHFAHENKSVHENDFNSYSIPSQADHIRTAFNMSVGNWLGVTHSDIPAFVPPLPKFCKNEHGDSVFDPSNNDEYLKYVRGFIAECNEVISALDERRGAVSKEITALDSQIKEEIQRLLS